MKKLYRLIFIYLLCISCDPYEVPKSKYPTVETLSPSSISSDGVILHAQITSLTKQPIIDHGFIWSQHPNPSISSGNIISLGVTNHKGSFKGILETGIISNKTYYTRAFIKTASHTIYGNIIPFVSKGSRTPILLDFTPKIADWGDTITISGDYLGNSTTLVEVRFGEYLSKVIGKTNSSITCIVPDNIEEKSVNVFITVGEHTVSSTTEFTLIEPIIIRLMSRMMMS